MRYLLFLLSLCISISAFGQKAKKLKLKKVKVRYENSKQIKEEYTVRKKARDVKEEYYYEYYKNGVRKTEGEYTNNEAVGYWVLYYENGEVASKGNYLKDEKSGAWETYHQNGNLASKGTYINGIRKGLFIDYHENGNKAKETNFEKGKEHGFQAIFDEEGNQVDLVEYVNGIKRGGGKTTAKSTTEKSGYVEVYDFGEEEIYKVVEEMPEFLGGDKAMLEFMYSEIQYPAIAKKNGIEGLVVVDFVITPNGNITNASIKRDIGGGCGEEAIRIVKEMPKWKPGKQRGKRVSVQFNLPVRFKLE